MRLFLLFRGNDKSALLKISLGDVLIVRTDKSTYQDDRPRSAGQNLLGTDLTPWDDDA